MFDEKFQPSLKEVVKELHDLYVYIDGRFVKGDEAKVSVWDHAFLYGDGVFEGIREYDGRIFKLDEHIDRLFDSAKGIGIRVPLTKEEVKKVVVETVRRNGLRDAHIRPIVARGVGAPGLDPNRCPRASLIVMAYPFPPILGEKPVKLLTSSVKRKSPHSVDSKIKSLNYLDNILAKMQSSAVGCDDAIMLDVNGLVAEGTGENIFFVKNGVIYTPTTVAALHGITRATIMEIAADLGYKTVEKDITIQELYSADEVFLTGTGAEVTAVGEIDGRRIGSEAPGVITKKIREEYFNYVRSRYVTSVYK